MYVRLRKDIIGSDFESYIANIYKRFSENFFVRFSTQFCHHEKVFFYIAFNLNYVSEYTWALKFHTFNFFNKL